MIATPIYRPDDFEPIELPSTMESADAIDALEAAWQRIEAENLHGRFRLADGSATRLRALLGLLVDAATARTTHERAARFNQAEIVAAAWILEIAHGTRTDPLYDPEYCGEPEMSFAERMEKCSPR